MKKFSEIALVVVPLVLCTGLTVGMTYAPCYSSLCSEEFFPYETRLHLATYFSLLASIGCALLLRASSPSCRRVSEKHLTHKHVPLLDRHITVGGLALAIWIVGIVIATTGFWVGAESDFWQAKAKPLAWPEAHIRIVVTGVIGHHADMLLGLLLIPVGRNSMLGRVFDLHYSTLLYAHKLIAYTTVAAVLAHGIAYYVSVALVAKYCPACADFPHLLNRHSWQTTLHNPMIALEKPRITLIIRPSLCKRQNNVEPTSPPHLEPVPCL